MLRYAQNQGLKGQREDKAIRWATTSKPTIGGISFFITFILAALVYFITQRTDPDFVSEFLGLVTVATLGFFIGLQDDAYNTRPLLKLMGQITCGVILIIFGTHIDLTGIHAIDYTLTVFWVVGIMNSVNLLDNMDAVTGTVSLTICATTLLLMFIFPIGPALNPFFFTLLALVGAIGGFLVLNWNPSRIYMGDTGSQFLGALLAFVGIKFFWNIRQMDPSIDVSMQIIAPIMVFLVPIMDTSFVTINRISKGNSPFVGGKDHLTHNMSYLGVPERFVPVVLGLVSLVSGLVAIFGVRYIAFWNVYHSIIFASYVVISFGIFFYIFKRGERMGHIKERFSKTLSRYFQEKKDQDSGVRKQEKLPS